MRTTALLAAGGVALAGLSMTAAGPAQAAAGCQVTYTANSWGTGFTSNIVVKNLGDAVTNWKLEFDFPGNQRVEQGWSATYGQSGRHVTVTNAAWNGSLATNASTGVGFNGSYSGTNVDPASFVVNGVPCGGVVDPSPPASPTTSVPPTTAPVTTAPVTTAPVTTAPVTTAPVTTTPVTPTITTTAGPAGAAPRLKVSGNKILTSDGKPYRLLGVSRSSGEFACVQGKGLWDGGPVDQASVDAMKTWNIHAVRIPLNEQCWLGLAGSPSGTAYQQGVKQYVDLLVANGINPILDLHWTWGAYTNGPDWHCKEATATCQKPMPDAQYAPQFWTGVANVFKGNDAVVLDLFNEPYPEVASDWNKTLGWECLRDGGDCTGLPYEAAGMQDLVDAVRKTGATNMLMVGGLEWANDMREWLTYKPKDPLDNIAASWHAYSFNACASVSCWDTQVAPLAEKVPVVLGEFGQDNCGYEYMDTLAKWADTHGLSHLAWTWNPWGCSTGAVLIKDWNGTPEPGVGEGYRAHLLSETPYE